MLKWLDNPVASLIWPPDWKRTRPDKWNSTVHLPVCSVVHVSLTLYFSSRQCTWALSVVCHSVSMEWTNSGMGLNKFRIRLAIEKVRYELAVLIASSRPLLSAAEWCWVAAVGEDTASPTLTIAIVRKHVTFVDIQFMLFTSLDCCFMFQTATFSFQCLYIHVYLSSEDFYLPKSTE